MMGGKSMALSLTEKYMFCYQMAMILSSGFAMEQGIEMIVEEATQEKLKFAVQRISDHLKEDSRLSYAVAQTGLFDEYMVHLIQVGEVSGNLDEVMLSLSDYYLRMDDMLKKFQQALTYPIILLLMMFVVVGVIVFQVLPIFEGVLKSLGSHLTSYAYTFMKCGQIFSMVGFVILAIIAVIIVSVYIYSRVRHISIMNQFIQKSFLTKSLARAMNHAQLTYALSMFIESGYDYSEAMQYALKLVDDVHLQEDLKMCCQDLENGMSFVETLKNHHIYQGMAMNMIQVGFKTGQMDQTMKMLTNQYQDEVSDAIDHFLNIVEPTIVTFLSVVVGIVLLSVLLPLMSIMASL